jgi:hypothetical protein
MGRSRRHSPGDKLGLDSARSPSDSDTIQGAEQHDPSLPGLVATLWLQGA